MNKIYDFFKDIYKNLNSEILIKAKKIKLLISDVDGVMSNGLIYMDDNQKELKSFNVKDNYGIKCLLKSSIDIAVISGRKSILVKNHCKSLGIRHIYLGKLNKLPSFKHLVNKLSLSLEEIAFIGDDLIDLPVLSRVGLSITTSDGHPILLKNVNYITNMPGGYGSLREVCDLILFAQKKFDTIKKYF